MFLLDFLHKNCCYNNRNWRALDCSVYLIVMFTIAVKVPRKHRGTSPSCSLHPSNLWLRHVNSYSKLLFSTTSTRFSYKRQRQRQIVGQTRNSTTFNTCCNKRATGNVMPPITLFYTSYGPTTESTVTLLKALRIL